MGWIYPKRKNYTKLPTMILLYHYIIIFVICHTLLNRNVSFDAGLSSVAPLKIFLVCQDGSANRLTWTSELLSDSPALHFLIRFGYNVWDFFYFAKGYDTVSVSTTVSSSASGVGSTVRTVCGTHLLYNLC